MKDLSPKHRVIRISNPQDFCTAPISSLPNALSRAAGAEGAAIVANTAESLALLIQNAELTLSLHDVEQLSQLVANIIDFVSKSEKKCPKKPFDMLVKAAGKIDLEKFSAIGNSFAIVFGELLENLALDVAGWQTVQMNLEMLVAGKHVRSFELMDYLQEEDRRKSEIAEAIQRREMEDEQKKQQADETQKEARMQELQRIPDLKVPIQ